MLPIPILTLLLALCAPQMISAFNLPEVGVPGQQNPTAAATPLAIPGPIPNPIGPNPFTKDQLEGAQIATIVHVPANSPIEVHGNKFFVKETGEQFFMKGIAYQPSVLPAGEVFSQATNSKFIDPMAETHICLRDLPYLKKLGVNLVRVYQIDTDRDHNTCFNAFAEAGIYIIADLSEPDISVVREAPTWDTTIKERYEKVVDSLHGYNNLFGFFAGNEVTNDRTNTDASPFVKASIRDIKAYIKEKGYRNIPVGYSTNDDAETRQSLADYFACGERDITVDFYGINMYEWCGYSTYWSSGYKDRTEEFKDYPVPVFFSEFGCNTKRPRPFTEVEALYGRLMTEVWSGGIAYMYFEEPNQYGVVEIVNGEVQELEDFESLRRQFNQAIPTGHSLDDHNKKALVAKIPNCPFNTKAWEASTDIPHTPDPIKCDCLESTLQCKLSPYVKVNELNKIFEYACGIVDCSDIRGNGSTGSYGAFSDCGRKQKASYVINEVFLKQGEGDPNNCDFNGLVVYNNRIADQNDLELRMTLDGGSCYNFLSKHSAFKVEQEVKKLKDANATSNNNRSSSGLGGGSGAMLNRANKLQFYNNLFSVVGASSILAILVSVLA